MRWALQGLQKLLAQLGPRKLALMGAVVAVLLVGIAALSWRGSPQMGFLYTDLDPSAAQTISEKLKAQGVEFTISPDGKAIMAPVDQLPQLRMSLASEKLGGKIGYEVLDQEEAFGVSSSRAKINETRAIEGELSKSIESLDNVERARVHIVMPERELFATQTRKASASVTLKTNGRMAPEAVQSVRYLVSSAVPDLVPTSISIVDQTGALLARAGEEGSAAAGDIDSQQTALEARLRSQVETMLEPIVGAGHVRAEVSATLERDRTTQEADVFDPDTQVIGHQVTVESDEQNDANTAGAEGVTVGAQLPDAAGPIGGMGGGDTQRAARKETSEDTTFQNSRTHTVSERAPGRLDRLSVAVMVDGGEKGLTQPQIQRLTRLVEGAVGFDSARGDNVVVESMRFVGADTQDGSASGLPFGMSGNQLVDFLKWAVVAVGLAVGAWFMRGRFRPALTEEQQQMLALEQQLLGGAPLPAFPGQEGALLQLEDGSDPHSELTMLDQEIALAQVDGNIRLSAIKRVGEAIERSPQEAVSVIRQWMNA
jgi:flagellar M-ring protein FliF